MLVSCRSGSARSAWLPPLPGLLMSKASLRRRAESEINLGTACAPRFVIINTGRVEGREAQRELRQLQPAPGSDLTGALNRLTNRGCTGRAHATGNQGGSRELAPDLPRLMAPTAKARMHGMHPLEAATAVHCVGQFRAALPPSACQLARQSTAKPVQCIRMAL